MTTTFDSKAVKENTIPRRYNRKDKKMLQDIEDELNERATATTAEITAAVAAIAVAVGQGTTGTAGDAGKITIAGMTSSGKVIVTAAEDPGENLVISHVVAGTGIITVYTRTVVEAGTTAAAALSGKKVNYIVISK